MSEEEYLRRKGSKAASGSSDESSEDRGSATTHPLLQLQAKAGNRATGAVIRRYVDGGTTYTDPDEAPEDEQATPGSHYNTYIQSLDDVHSVDDLFSPDSDEEQEDEHETPATYVYASTPTTYLDSSTPTTYLDSFDDMDSHQGLISPDSDEDEDDDEVEVEVDTTTTKHAAALPMAASHRGEQISSGDFARMLYASASDAAPRLALRQAREELQAAHPGAEPKFIEKMAARRAAGADLKAFADRLFTTHFGWTQDEIDRHIHGDEPVAVKYLDESARKEYALKGRGGNLTIGASDRPADTTQMWSKHSGKGWGIFVMNGSGEIYAEAHKMGMFHHSSFTAGGDVAAAGEIRIRNGVITGITNKSGHYQPKAKDMLTLFRELRDRGVNLRNIEFKDFQGNAIPGGAEAYLFKHDGPDVIDDDDDDDDEATEARLAALGIVHY